MNFDEAIGKQIRLARTLKGLRANVIAHEVGLSAPVYSQYENGKRRMPLHRFVTICTRLEASPGVVIESALNDIVEGKE